MLMPINCAVAACWLSPVPAGGASIERVVPFATADSVRIHATLRSARPRAGVVVSARIRPAGGTGPVLWEGPLTTLGLAANTPADIARTIGGLKPELWSPGSPVLYDLALTATHDGQVVATHGVRLGFRSVETRDGQILLNGKPVFLCGLAINPPGRGVPEATGFSPEFARDYVRFLRSRNFNCIRMNLPFVADPRAQVWFDACDELGMLVYQGCYGAPPTGIPGAGRTMREPPEDLEASVAAYREVFETYARHPSVIIYVLANELPYTGTRGQAWHEFLTAAHRDLERWDSTRLYIGNAGFGEGREGDINDVHRYWGWYYNSFLTYYNLRRAHEIFGEKGAVQPFTFSECVGSFTSTLGEVNLTYRKQLGAQLHWTGHSPEQARDALAYHAFMAHRAGEAFRTLREVNPRLAGLMPFTILFHHWNGITRSKQMQPKPAADSLAAAYQPVLLAWEVWTPQVHAGAQVRAFAHVVNDAEDFSDLTGAQLQWVLQGSAHRTLLQGEVEIPPVLYYGHHKLAVTLDLPASAPTDDYVLAGSITRGGRLVSRNRVTLFVAGRRWREPIAALRETSPAPVLYDPVGRTGKALAVLGLHPQRITSPAALPAGTPLIVGEDSAGGDFPGEEIGAFVRRGGRVLLLGQDHTEFDAAWLPARIEMLTGSANDPEYFPRNRPTRDQMYVNVERPDHPVFAGLDRSRLRLWSDYTGWDQTKPGFPAIYPVTRGFKLTRPEDLAHTAVLANYDRGLEGIAICEVFSGEGSVVFTSLDLVRRIGVDPVADRMLANLVAYLSAKDHPIHPLIEAPIQWGRYASEKGVITGPLNGLVVNCRWVRPPTDPDAKPMPDNEGAWNVLPGDQYVAIGRRPIGPYTYNTGTAVVELDKDSPVGAGVFHARIPIGRTAVVTRVENPSSREGRIEIAVNGSVQIADVPPGDTVTLRNPLPGATAAVNVRIAGHKHLVLLETTFE